MALRVTLPDNPAPEGINCVRIYYPDHPGFLTAVLSVVRYLENWYAWERDDAKQGKIAAASFRRASLRTVTDLLAGIGCGDCDGDGNSSTEHDLPSILNACGGLIVLEDESDMGQVVTNVEIVDGVLKVYFGPCCIFEYPITAGSIIAGEPDTDPGDLDPEEWTDALRSCAVATALAEIWQGVAEQCAEAPFNSLPWNYVGYVQNAFPALLFDNSMVYKAAEIAFANAIGVALTGSLWLAEIGIDDDTVQRIKCKFYEILLYGSHDVWFDATMFTSLRAAIDAEATNGLNKEFWLAAWDSFANKTSNFPVIASQTTAQDPADLDCSCPGYEPLEDPTANGWYLSEEFEVSATSIGDYNTKSCIRRQAGQDVFGCVFKATWTDALNLKRMSSANAGCTNFDQAAWGDTSDHLEYEPQETWFGQGAASVLDEILGTGNYVQKSSNYGTPTNPASPTWNAGTVISHGFYGDALASGESYTVKMRFIYNTNSPSHA